MTTVSARPTLITGHDATLAIRGLTRGDHLTVTVNGTPFPSGTFHTSRACPVRRQARCSACCTTSRSAPTTCTPRSPGERYGTRTMQLRLLVHSLQGPIITGPHQEPFICATERAVSGRPHGNNCLAKQRIHWWYKDNAGSSTD